MSLSGWLDSVLPEIGTDTTKVRPINEGEQVLIVEDQEGSNSVWGFLDGLGDQVSGGVGSYIKNKIGKEFDRQTFGSEASQDTTGDPNYNTGQVGKTAQSSETFIDKYKVPLLISAGLLAGLLVLKKL